MTNTTDTVHGYWPITVPLSLRYLLFSASWSTWAMHMRAHGAPMLQILITCDSLAVRCWIHNITAVHQVISILPGWQVMDTSNYALRSMNPESVVRVRPEMELCRGKRYMQTRRYLPVNSMTDSSYGAALCLNLEYRNSPRIIFRKQLGSMK
ncbi:hypothetical protein F5X97DRAFT_98565 [Nemania serpens]|nr:hypothetical protein F5X97DRAFT_98565 [Nemania serpens]